MIDPEIYIYSHSDSEHKKLEKENQELREALNKAVDMLKRVSADYSQAEYARAVLVEIKED